MAKFSGVIGFATTAETSPGVWTDQIVEQEYVGDILDSGRTWRYDLDVNPDVTISDTISIIADGLSLSTQHTMKYVKWRGETLAITKIKVERPRVILAIGGLYNGPTS